MCPEFRSRIPLRSLRNPFANFAVMGLSLQTVAKTRVFNRKVHKGIRKERKVLTRTPRNFGKREHERNARVYTPAEAEWVFTGTEPLLDRFTFNSRSDITCRSAGFEK